MGPDLCQMGSACMLRACNNFTPTLSSNAAAPPPPKDIAPPPDQSSAQEHRHRPLAPEPRRRMQGKERLPSPTPCGQWSMASGWVGWGGGEGGSGDGRRKEPPIASLREATWGTRAVLRRNSCQFFCRVVNFKTSRWYSLRPLVPVFNMMYLDTKTCLDISCQRQVLVVGGNTFFS
jgi:hypothetical protein